MRCRSPLEACSNIVETIQGVKLCEFVGPLDPARGRYAVSRYSNVANAMTELRQRIPLLADGQFIWASLTQLHRHGERGRFLHRIKVHPDDIIGCVRSVPWHIIREGQHRVYVPHEMELRLKDLAIKCEDYDSELERLRQKLWSRYVRINAWATVFRTGMPLRTSDELLLRFPLKLSRIVEVQTISG